MTFDEVNVNQGSLYNSNNGIVTISTSGYYYLYISAGAEQREVSSTPRPDLVQAGPCSEKNVEPLPNLRIPPD